MYRITYLWGDFETYTVLGPDDCRDETDRAAVRILADLPREQVITMGKICVQQL